jgi:beta-N-acetylhexosaminidase
VNDTAELARGVVMAGIAGSSFDARLPHLGGYILFGRDGGSVAGIRELTDALRARDGRPAPVIAIDQEGGAVARIRDGVEPMPSMMALGAADDIDLAQRAGEQIAFDLRRGGCTLDFAPVLDLALEPANTVIGTRSFGADPQLVASLGAAFARGLMRGGILPCYKHFPGHGATAVDSHEALPIVDVNEATLRSRDLVPFAAVARNAPAMMSAHVVVRAFDAQRPATLSPRTSALLRDELGFRGAFITDCLEMHAVAAGDSVEAAVDALAAGADLMLFSHDLELAAAAASAIADAVDRERVPLSRLEEAGARVLRLREAGTAPLPLDAFPPHPGVGREIARRAVTLVRGLPHADPVASVVVSFGGSQATLARESPALEELSASLDPTSDELAAILDKLNDLERRPLLLARRAHRHAAQAAAILQILDGYPDALVVSLLEPFDVGLFTSARHLLAVYGDDAASIGGLADVIFGGSMPTGHLPVTMSSAATP